MMSPNMVARSMWLFGLRLHGALVIFERLQISQCGFLRSMEVSGASCSVTSGGC